MSDAGPTAIKVAERLLNTSDDLEFLGEENAEIEAVLGCPEFHAVLDSIAFQCVRCSYWKRQYENATPNADQWTCQECVE